MDVTGLGVFGGTRWAVLEAPNVLFLTHQVGRLSHHVGRFGGTMLGWTVLEAPGGPFLRHQVGHSRDTRWAVFEAPGGPF